MLLPLALTRLPGIGSIAPTELLRADIDLEWLFALKYLPETEIESLSPLGRKRLSEALEGKSVALERAKRELDFCERHGIKCLVLGSADYPARLAECPDAPAVLFYQGTADLNARHLLTVVGTRHITEQGKLLCKELCADIARLLPDAIIVSGLAYGVDIHAHRAALGNGLPTVGVLAHGLDRIYPALHRHTALEMTKNGGLLTEFFTGTNPDKGNFVRRNRIVAGLSMGTVVVESAAKGGALLTAGMANSYSREVFAFPGRSTDEFSAGCNALIKTQRAALVENAEDIIKGLNWDIEARRPRAIEQELLPDFSADETAVRSALQNSDGLLPGEIAALSGLPFSQVMALLFDLEMRGFVKAAAGGRFILLR